MRTSANPSASSRAASCGRARGTPASVEYTTTAASRVRQRRQDVLVGVLGDEVERTREMALAVARRRLGVDDRDRGPARHRARRGSCAVVPRGSRRCRPWRAAPWPRADLEAFPGAQAPGSRDLGVGAHAALPAERPEVDAVVLDERAQEGRVGGQPVLRSRRDDAARRAARRSARARTRPAGGRPGAHPPRRAHPRGRRRARGWGESAARPSPSRGPRRADGPGCRW